MNKETVRQAARYILAAVLAVFLLFGIWWGTSTVRFTYAASSTAVQEAYENTEVLDDLEGSIIGGKVFDVADYPHNDLGELQVISFAEFCYSYWSNKQSDYALYVYIYNPCDYVIDTSSTRNKIEIAFASESNLYNKYGLQFIKYSQTSGYEGRFYKFKVILSDSQKQEVLSQLNQNSRVYYVSSVELSIGGNVEDYTFAQVYTYSGYAAGYGSEFAEGNTLSCIQDGFDKYLSLEVQSTYYRPEGSNGKTQYTHDSLSSVYFAVPKRVVDEYGAMTRIRGEYLKALTSEIFVTGDEDYYSEFYQVLGQDIGYLVPDSDDFESMIFAQNIEHAFPTPGVSTSWVYNMPEILVTQDDDEDTIYFSRLNYLLYASSGDADSYAVSSSELKTYMEWYTQNCMAEGEGLVSEKYAESLFAWVDSEITQFDITSDDVTQSLTSEVITQTWWDKMWGTTTTTESEMYTGKEAIHVVQDKDFVSYNGTSAINISATCDNLYIAESDYEEFSAFYEANKQDNYIYLIRFAVDDYVSAEAIEAHFDRLINFGSGGNPDWRFIYDDDNTNCYLAQEYVYLDFDIIDLTFTKNNVETVIPVIMSPMDIVPDITPDPDAEPAGGGCSNGLSTVLLILGLLVLIVIIGVLSPILPYVVSAIIWIISAPFKAIAAIFKGIKKATKKESKKDTGQSSENAKQAAKRAKKAAKEANKAAKQAKKATKKKE